MFKSSFPTVLSVIIGFLIFTSELNAQVQEHVLPDLRKAAIDNYNSGDYLSAEADFRKLMRQFPEDPMYRYYSGICKVKLDKEIEQAAEQLYFASRRGVPADVEYYLGEAYRKLYDFKRAEKHFSSFDKNAGRAEAKEKHSRLKISSSIRAQEITAGYNPYDVLNVTFLNLSDPVQSSRIRMKGGVLSKKPEVLFSESENQKDLNALMFIPEKVEKGDLVFFAGLEKNGKNGFQIMQAKKGNNDKWVDIEPIDDLNTELNEILPYFDPVGRDIYFASDGFEGLGGLDLFRSHYDELTKKWSEPVNLGFPVNSVYDDYLFLPGTDLGMVMIFTGRNVIDTAVAVYRVHFSEPKQSLTYASPDEIRRIANFGGAAAEVLSELGMDRQKDEDVDDAKRNSVPLLLNEDVPASKKDDKTKKTEYQDNISIALRHQALSDSLTELASAARVRVRDSEDPNDRWIYQKQIIVWEKKALEEQEQADHYFSLIAGSDQVRNEVIEKDTVINDMTVYKYVIADSIAEKARNAFNAVPGDKAPEKKPNDDPETQEVKKMEEDPTPGKTISRFEILASSPYGENNPIPVDPELPAGSFYRIQLGVFSKAVEMDAFGGLAPISAETVPDRNLIRYYAGKFNNYSDAEKALSVLKTSGNEDAFIVSWYNGSRMSIDKVRKLEK